MSDVKTQTPQRLDKIIASQTSFSRSEARRLVREGRVTVDGRTARSADCKVQPGAAVVAVDGRPIRYEKHAYFMLNKPTGVLSAVREPGRLTVTDLVEQKTGRRGLFPVGRLDRDTTGLILLTDDGDFAHRIISPNSRIEKTYRAQLDGPVTPDMIRRFARGVTLADGTACLPAVLRRPEPDQPCLAEIRISEGKYHQVKRMFGAVGLGVVSLERIRIGALVLDPSLAPGDCRPLSPEEKRLALTAEQDKPKIEE